MSIVEQLTAKLGIDDSTAKGGLGAIGDFAKGQLPDDSFEKLKSSIPGLESMMGNEGGGKEASGGIGGLMGGIASGLTDKLGSIGGAAELMAKLKSLGLDETQIMGFVEQVLSFLEDKGMGDIASKVKSMLPQG